MSVLKAILIDLRDRKLWPVAVALVVALVAVPVLLSKKSSTTNVAQLPQLPPTSSGSKLPAISVSTSEAAGKLSGRGRDPFTQPKVTASTITSTGTSAAGAPSSSGATVATAGGANTAGLGGSSSSAGGGVPTGATVSSGSPVPTAPAPTSTIPTPKAPPAPTGLTATESYDVALAITNPSGGLNTIDPLERLSPLPSPQRPLVVELGVLEGGHRVLFAVQPGTVVGGPGTCTPGPIDCEVLSLAPGQTEGVSLRTANGVKPVALFAVTQISADHHPTVAAADKARQASSPAGRRLLAKSTLSALSLFDYEPSIGALVDQRNLTVGGN